MNKHVIVVGAGIAGLTAAIYSKRNGFDVTLIEQHNMAGGMCTSWKRKGYLFEGAVHWLTGTSPKIETYQIWKDTGALNEKIPIFLSDPFNSLEYEGQNINLYRDIDRTAAHWRDISPQDENAINQLVNDVKELCATELQGFDESLNQISNRTSSEKFVHPGIRRLIGGEFVNTFLLLTLAFFHMGDGGYPEGGSLAMVERMKKTYMDLGGKLLLGTKVLKVNIENYITTGVTLKDNILNADAVIITQETIAALEQLFDQPLQEAWLDDLRNTTNSSVCTFVCVGVRVELPKKPNLEWKLPEPITYAENTLTDISFNNYSGYEGYAPEGGTALTAILSGDTYDFWKQAKEAGHYIEEKKDLADQISRAICKEYPQAEGKIEVVDIATPLTYERYTGAYHGSWMSYLHPGEKMKYYPGFIESINGLYFAGHRLMSPGGLPVAATSGRNAAQMVCRQFDMEFR